MIVFFSEFDEIPTRGGKLPKLFIRKFKDKISSSNAAEWWNFILNADEKKIYTIITPDEEKRQLEKQMDFSLDVKRNKISKKFSSIYPLEEEIVYIINCLHIFPDLCRMLRGVFDHYLPLEIEIDAIIKFTGEGSLVSVFAGTAFIENLLRLRNVDVKATDNYSNINSISWMEVDNINISEAINNKYHPDVLLMTWPLEKKSSIPSAMAEGSFYMSTSGYYEMIDELNLSEREPLKYEYYSDALYAIKEFKGNKFIYVGDKMFCCECNALFSHYLEENFEKVNSGITLSKIHFYIRKPTN